MAGLLNPMIAAATALGSLALEVLGEHRRHCVAHALPSGDEQETRERTKEWLEAVHRSSSTR
jgi:DNA-binding FrmR family transcriptional regulator